MLNKVEKILQQQFKPNAVFYVLSLGHYNLLISYCKQIFIKYPLFTSSLVEILQILTEK